MMVNMMLTSRRARETGGIVPDGRELVKMVLMGVRVCPSVARAECFSGWRSAWLKRVPNETEGETKDDEIHGIGQM